jgi:hypothetical protein
VLTRALENEILCRLTFIYFKVRAASAGCEVGLTVFPPDCGAKARLGGFHSQVGGGFIEVGFQLALGHPSCGPNDDWRFKSVQ